MSQDLEFLANGEQFDAYCGQVVARLEDRRARRLTFLKSALGRLDALTASAEALGDDEVAAELVQHREGTLTQIRELEAVVLSQATD